MVSLIEPSRTCVHSLIEPSPTCVHSQVFSQGWLQPGDISINHSVGSKRAPVNNKGIVLTEEIPRVQRLLPRSWNQLLPLF